ncbi:MAG TPA: phosphoribosylglycinamide formyltransferase [Gammaproteobacteria bacterium]|nr:phosphoribosylglycinamide formyltransferase [Gammaproteobacteria bacterium]
MIQPLDVVVLISGNGSNLQALIDGMQAGRLPIRINAVISDRPGAFGLERAERAAIAAQAIAPRDFPGKEAWETALAAAIDLHSPGLVVLAGFMRVLSAAFVRHYRGRMLNIHPSLLPKYRGLHTHRRALEAGDATHGASVHFVTEELDGGPVILQAEVPVLPGDDEASLAARVQAVEHVIYPQAVRLFAEGRIRMRDDGQVEYDGMPLTAPLPAQA